MSKPLKVFITYSHKNTKAKDQLITRLALLKREGIIDIWHDNEILPGDKWRDAIFNNLADSDLLLYLTSAYSLESENCNKELAAALTAEKKVIPIILEHCNWKSHKLENSPDLSAKGLYLNESESQILGEIQALPDRGKPLNEWRPRSKGWESVLEGIREVIDEMQSHKAPSSETSEKELRAESMFQHGNTLMLLRQLNMAIKVYSDAIKLNPRYAEMYNNRGVAFSLKGKYDLGIKDYTEAINLNPNFASAYGNRGTAYKETGDVDSAIKDYTTAINLDPDSANAYDKRGWAYFKKGEANRAIRDYNKAIELKPDFTSAYNNRGIVYANKDNYNRAITDFDRAIKLNSRFAKAYCNRGEIYRRNENYDRAIADFNTTINLTPDFPQAYYNRGTAYHDKGDYDCAISDFDRAIDLSPDNAEAYHNRGAAYAKKGDYDCAISDFDRAIDLSPDNAEAYHNRGIIYGLKDKYDRAIKDFNTAIELKRDYVEAYKSRGIAYRAIGDFDDAIENFIKAIKLKPDYAEAYYHRGATYGYKNEVDIAIEDYTKAIELKPDYAEAYHIRGTAYGKKGELDTAIADFNTAIELKSNYAEAYSNRGNARVYKGEFDTAIIDYTHAIQFRQDYAEAYSNRGVAYFKKGEVNKAIEDYTQAIQLKPDYPNPYYNRGEALLNLREWTKAKADLTTAKRIGMDIIAAFHNSYKNVETYEKRHRIKLPEDIAHMLTQRRRTRYPKTQKVLDAEGNPLESPNVVNLRAQLRNAGIPLGEYVKTKPAFGINTAPTEAFVVDKATRDELIAVHPSSADILKPFLHGQDLRRWHVDTPHQWLIFTHRGIAINDYPAILEHLKKYREPLRKRKGKQEWYELPASLGNAERFAQPKLVCPDTYNHQTFAVDTAGYYYGNTSYLIPTEETWLCGLLNSRTVEWFYSQVSNQLTIDYLRARSGYIQQIPIPDLTSTQKALIAKIVDYLIYLQQQPTINSKDLAHARDHIMLGYFERIIDGLVYEVYLPEDLHKGDKHFFQPLLEEQLPSCEEIQADKMTTLREIFELLYERTHLVRRNLYYLDSVKAVRIIEGKI